MLFSFPKKNLDNKSCNKNGLLFQLDAMNIYRKQSMSGVPWNQFKSEILYLSSALKEPV